MLSKRGIGGLGTTRENRLQNAAVASKEERKLSVACMIVQWTLLSSNQLNVASNCSTKKYWKFEAAETEVSNFEVLKSVFKIWAFS